MSRREASSDLDLAQIISELDLGKGTMVPVIIPSFNNPTYLLNMIDQLEALSLSKILVLDGGSSYPKMIDALESLSDRFPIVNLQFNPGPRYAITSQTVLDALPTIFALTDPDLSFNPNLPSDFVEVMIDLGQEICAPKIGFALDISNSERMRQEKFKIGEDLFTIEEWERQFWDKPLGNRNHLPLYQAQIDTTFAIYNQNYYSPDDFLSAFRVAGEFTAVHLPWMLDTLVPESELKFYKESQTHSYYSLR